MQRYDASGRFGVRHLSIQQSSHWNGGGDGAFGPTFIATWDPTQGVPTTDKVYGDPPAPDAAVQGR